MAQLEDQFTQAELAFIEETGVVFEEVNGTTKVVDEDLVTDFIMIAGMTTTEAYEAAQNVAKYDDLSF